MNCPKCEGTELAAVMAKEGALVDFCPDCKGIWLAKGEMTLLAAPKTARLRMNVDPVSREASKGGGPLRPSRRCRTWVLPPT